MKYNHAICTSSSHLHTKFGHNQVLVLTGVGETNLFVKYRPNEPQTTNDLLFDNL